MYAIMYKRMERQQLQGNYSIFEAKPQIADVGTKKWYKIQSLFHFIFDICNFSAQTSIIYFKMNILKRALTTWLCAWSVDLFCYLKLHAMAS